MDLKLRNAPFSSQLTTSVSDGRHKVSGQSLYVCESGPPELLLLVKTVKVDT